MAGTEGVEDFLAALKHEILLRKDRFGSASYETLFFGGGTPSLLTPRQVEGVLACLHAAFHITSGVEITLEANPGTVTRESLAALRSLGINRLSVGVQSFHDHELAFLGRIHDSAEAVRCVDWSRTAGFENVSMDLIYSVPGQTLHQWEANLRAAVDLAPRHIAAYSLIVEDRTPLARMVEAGAVHRNPADREAAMYERTMELLAAYGYEQYEVSNYALPGFRCRHNCAYWSHEDYLGLGPSAHSFWKADGPRRGRRWWNVSDLFAYTAALARGGLPIASDEELGPRELAQERILLGLRSGGLDLARLAADMAYDLPQHPNSTIRWMVEEGLALREGQMLRLTAKGYVLCDEISNRLAQDATL